MRVEDYFGMDDPRQLIQIVLVHFAKRDKKQ